MEPQAQSNPRLKRAALSRKQQRFIEEYAQGKSGAQAARDAGYKDGSGAARVTATRTLANPNVKAALAREEARIALKITPQRVQTRLDEISREAQGAGQFGPAVRAEELLGKSIGMWIDQSVQLSGALTGSHVQALLALARKRQQEPIDLEDDGDDNWQQRDDRD